MYVTLDLIKLNLKITVQMLGHDY